MANKIIARHKWVADATITESYNPDIPGVRRFTATICGWRNWKIAEGNADNATMTETVIKKVRQIKNRIEFEDEAIFNEPNNYTPLWEENEVSENIGHLNNKGGRNDTKRI